MVRYQSPWSESQREQTMNGMAWTSCTSPDRQLGPGVLDPYRRLAEDAKGEGNGHVCDRRKRNESVEKGPLHA